MTDYHTLLAMTRSRILAGKQHKTAYPFSINMMRSAS